MLEESSCSMVGGREGRAYVRANVCEYVGWVVYIVCQPISLHLQR